MKTTDLEALIDTDERVFLNNEFLGKWEVVGVREPRRTRNGTLAHDGVVLRGDTTGFIKVCAPVNVLETVRQRTERVEAREEAIRETEERRAQEAKKRNKTLAPDVASLRERGVPDRLIDMLRNWYGYDVDRFRSVIKAAENAEVRVIDKVTRVDIVLPKDFGNDATKRHTIGLVHLAMRDWEFLCDHYGERNLHAVYLNVDGNGGRTSLTDYRREEGAAILAIILQRNAS